MSCIENITLIKTCDITKICHKEQLKFAMSPFLQDFSGLVKPVSNSHIASSSPTGSRHKLSVGLQHILEALERTVRRHVFARLKVGRRGGRLKETNRDSFAPRISILPNSTGKRGRGRFII
jgi:hypothetical protein